MAMIKTLPSLRTAISEAHFAPSYSRNVLMAQDACENFVLAPFKSPISLQKEESSIYNDSDRSSSPIRELDEASDNETQSYKRSREEEALDIIKRQRRSSISSDISEGEVCLSESDSLPSSPTSSSQPVSPIKSFQSKLKSLSAILNSGRRYSKDFLEREISCTGNGNCSLCRNGIPYYLNSTMNPGWRESILAIFQYFGKRRTKSEWLRLQKHQEDLGDLADDNNGKQETEWLYFPDAYTYVEHHWALICPPQHKERSFDELNWRKTMQDTFSHNRTYFVSGKKVFGRTGFWRISDKAPLHNILKESNKQIVERLTQMERDQPKAVSYPVSVITVSNATNLAVASREAQPAFCRAEVTDASSLHYLLAAIESLQD